MSNFCAEPWKQIFIGPDSKIKTCCAGRVDLGDLQKNNIEEILNAAPLREIKEYILEGKWHPNCGLCRELELNGVQSQRHRTQEEVSNIDFYKKNKNYHVPDLLDVRWDNTCNLACNYCNSYFSSVWASIKKEYQIAPRDNDGILEYVKKNSDNIKHAILLGGEPFLQRKNIELLENLNENCSVLLLTNLSIPLENNQVYKNLSKFKYLSFHLSFETIGNRFEYVRHNASWQQFTKNLSKIKSDFPLAKIVARPLYCLYSAFNLLEYYDFIDRQDIEIQWQKIEGPEELNVNFLPKDLRKHAIQEIENVLMKYTDDRYDLETLRSLHHSLSLDNKELEISRIKKYHDNLETNLHKKNYLFKELWPLLNEKLYVGI